MTVRIRPAELGWKGLLLLATLLAAFFATSYSNLFFLLLAFCAALGGLGAFWTWRNLRGIEVLRIEVDAAPTDSERPVQVHLRGQRRHFGIEFGLRCSRERHALGRMDMLVGTARAPGTLPPQPRGLSTFYVQLQSRAPFGLFQATCSSPLAIEVVTYPAPLGTANSLDQIASGGVASSSGGSRAAHSGADADVAGLRPFRPGDAPREVHWKASARRGEPVVMEREPHGALPREIVIDRRASSFERDLAAAATAVLASSARSPVRLCSQGIELRCDGDAAQRFALLRWLATATPLPADAGPPQPASPHRGRV